VLDTTKYAETPLMKQYNGIKEQYPDALLLFRVGDFYETFGEDAIRASGVLGITLTKRANGSASFVELAGFPYHALETYLPKLVRAGLRVAVCDQLEDPKLTKTIVKRGITELVTPGVALNDNILERKENNFLAAIHFSKNTAGIALVDISTGEFIASEGNFDYIERVLANFQPKEVVFERSKEAVYREIAANRYYSFKLDDWMFNEDSGKERLLKHFNVLSLKGFGIEHLPMAIVAAGAIIHYLNNSQHENLKHISSISRIDENQYVWLDRFTIRNLELFNPINEGGKPLIQVIDHTSTPMGARLLKRWLAMPLNNTHQINERLNAVDCIYSHEELLGGLQDSISQIGDMERIISKISALKANPRDLIMLKNALVVIDPIQKLCLQSENTTLKAIANQLNPCYDVVAKVTKEIDDDPPVLLNKGGVVKSGVSAELDELKSLMKSGKDFILQMQQREIEKTGINSLKIGFNNVFGYYIEVRNTHKEKVPDYWIRKQTLVNAERYITEELKEYEQKILTAESKILDIETQIFQQLIAFITSYIEVIQLNASLVARLDCLSSFACTAINNNYRKPVVNDSMSISIKAGRHAVIETLLPADKPFIANDVLLDSTNEQIIIITGPNMSGKSALLRQTALIVLMAQMGSFVPAEAASIGIVDKVFTRVGASDNISQGESTFMVEMNEAASILNNLSPRSLVLLDEIGRGTSTYDGISIAWAITEYLHEHPQCQAKTMFATHYHELIEMEKAFSRIRNFNVSVKEVDQKILFLRKLQQGGSAHSFGIHVAQLAGMPKSVIKRANEVLNELENSGGKNHLSKPVNDIPMHREGMQLSFFQLDDPVLKQIRDDIKKLDLNNLTPLEALNKLNDIKRMIGL